ncbi:MAG: hypothetical protein M3144_02495 [Actinomycetota bacterium]|nr:hypothetical protein [Actinomycetota bacterium]
MVSFELPPPARKAVESHTKLIAGIRPEDFHDVATGERPANAACFKATIDVIEWMGSEVFVYFPVGRGEHADQLAELAQELDQSVEVPGAEDQVVARLDADSNVSEGRDAELWFDPSEVHLFDPDTGLNLTRESRAGDGAGR